MQRSEKKAKKNSLKVKKKRGDAGKTDDFEGREELVKYEECAGKAQIRRRKKEIDRQRK